MDDLIRRKDALQAIAQLPLPYGVQRDKIITTLYEVPAADAVEVVRCKDCKLWCRNCGVVDSPNGHCFCHDIETNGHDFCSYGERRTDDETGS